MELLGKARAPDAELQKIGAVAFDGQPRVGLHVDPAAAWSGTSSPTARTERRRSRSAALVIEARAT
ncbi:MAG: hypothetical protein R3F34_20165 [Planctomycetota bacterium]